jgi:ribose transport system ATP-binding protein
MSAAPGSSVVASVRGISKSFGGVTVVSDVDLEFHAGEVHVLAGENGAGKSTVTKLLSGIHQPDSGEITIDGRVGPFDVRSASAAGVAIVHQELLIAPNLTVADNLAMGREYRSSSRLLDRRATRARAREQLEFVGAGHIPVNVRAEELSVAEHQLIEIARAISTRPKVLILDEPTSALASHETENLLRIVRELRAAGTAVIYITHRMEEIEAIADTVSVMRDGRLIETMPIETATPDAIVLRMVGRQIDSLFSTDRSDPGEVVLSVRGLTDGKHIGPIDLDVRAGEVVGIGGLIGSGRSEFVRLIFGADTPTAGTVTVDGKPCHVEGGPSATMKAGIALLPESRKTQGLVLEQSISANVVLSSLSAVSTGGFVNPASVRRAAAASKKQLNIRSASLGQEVATLSGGNQQKVLFAKWLRSAPRILILDEPTRGVDVGAKADIYKIINDSAKAGMAVLVISSELPELIGLSDRVHVMREGRLVAELDSDGLTEEAVMNHAFGLAPASNL